MRASWIEWLTNLPAWFPRLGYSLTGSILAVDLVRELVDLMRTLAFQAGAVTGVVIINGMDDELITRLCAKAHFQGTMQILEAHHRAQGAPDEV